jgi:beta-galactosidase
MHKVSGAVRTKYIGWLFLISISASACCHAESNSSSALLTPPGGGVYVGVDYYPEQWPEERWETDLKLMHDAGFNVVRLAEFSWVLYEPTEGQIDFGWLDRWLELAKKYDIRAILGTPTAIMPAWMAKKYPEALAMKLDGTRIVWGGRRDNCFSDPDYHRLSDRIVRAMGEHFANNSQVVGWQIDNELGGTDCRCDKCKTNFQKWLEKKYGTLAELNRAWGTRFWAQTYDSWDEIPIPADRVGDWAISNPSASLDWQRFTSDLNIDFLDNQASILRQTCPGSQFITHNFMGLHRGINYYRLAKQLDFVAWDDYPKLSPGEHFDSALGADLMRGLKKQNFLIMEQTAGPLGWSVFSRNPQPGELRKICYQHLAHGADGELWFRWRSCTVGREEYWHGLLGHDGIAGRRYHEAAKFAQEFQRLAPALRGTSIQSKVAILYDYDSLWALEIQNGYPGASYQDAIRRYYNALNRAGVNVDIVKPGDDLTGYKLVLAPHLHVLADDVAQALVDYVRAGGVLLADCRTGVKDETDLAYARTLPGLLSPALGIEIDEYESLRLGISDSEEVKYSIQANGRIDGSFPAIHYADWITPKGAEIVARYGQPHFKQYAAVTRNQLGKGIGWYVGTIVDESDFYDKLVAQLLKDASIRAIVSPPRGVEVSTRQDSDVGLLFVINHTDQAVTVNVPSGKPELLTSTTTGETLELDGFGVAVIKLSAAELAANQQ